MVATVLKLSKGKRRLWLVDMSGVRETQAEAREYFGSEESKAAWSASVLLTSTPVSSAISNLWIAVHSSAENPGKQFTSEADAIEWLRGFVE